MADVAEVADVAVAAGLNVVVGPKLVSTPECVGPEVGAALVGPVPDAEIIMEDKTSTRY